MILGTLTAAALSTYTIKTALGIVRDQDVRDALYRFKSGASQVAHIIHGSVIDTATSVREKRRIAGFARQNNLLVTHVFESATAEERQTLINILKKYGSE